MELFRSIGILHDEFAEDFDYNKRRKKGVETDVVADLNSEDIVDSSEKPSKLKKLFIKNMKVGEPEEVSESDGLLLHEKEKATSDGHSQDSMLSSNDSVPSVYVAGVSNSVAESKKMLKSRQEIGHEEGLQEKLASYFKSKYKQAKKLLGLSEPCVNGGSKNMQGECVCPQYFEGERCETLVCVNNGTIIEQHGRPATCRCPHSAYITGRHCEIVKCENNGAPLKNGFCRCLDYWYTGQFCENYTNAWAAVISVPIICIVFIVICCVICRMDFCPRRKVRQRRRQPGNATEAASVRTGRWLRSVEEQMNQRHAAHQRGCDSALRLQENLLNEETVNRPRAVRSDPNVIPSYTIRLDTIPVFNPRMIGGVGEQEVKPVEPPPPYDQAIALSPSSRIVNQSSAASLPRPPEYTPYNPQPPPNVRSS